MNQDNKVVVKTSKGVIALLVILVIAVIGLSVYVVTEDKDKCDVVETKEETKEENETEEVKKVEDNSQYLKTATEVYTNAYNVINAGESYSYNESELNKYFTKKAIEKIYKLSVNNNEDLKAGIFFEGVFGRISQNLRNITFVSATDDTIIVNAQLTNNPNGDNDPYPMYIVLKKDSNTYKIDLF